MPHAPLTRSHDGRVLAGVCAGLAAHLGLPVVWVRVIMAATTLLGGAGALLYLWFWVTVPGESGSETPPMRRALTKPAADLPAPTATEPGRAASGSSGADAGTTARAASTAVATPFGAAYAGAADPAAAAPPAGASPEAAAAAGLDSAPQPIPLRRWPVAELLLGVCLLIAAVALVLVQFGVQLRLEVVLPGVAVLAGVGLAWWQIADRDRPERNQLPRVLGALALVAVGVLMFFVTARQPDAFTVIAAAFAVLAGVALAAAPWLLRLNRELIAERAGRAREAERAEIAAHLHDSVLQTLAAIQQRSDPGSEVARLARGQERELRDWLFRAADGAEPPPRESLVVELRTHAAELERAHAVRFEIVSVGADRAAAPEALLGSAREAMLNAARHAGGDVTVYLEATPEHYSVDVTDRGPGLDLSELPEGRMGVRESILGRMQRAGGSATIVAGPGGDGTSVRLSLPRAAESADAAASARAERNEGSR